MINIILQKLKEQYKSVLVYAGGLVSYTLLMFSVFPTIQKMDLTALMNSYPPEIAKFFSSSGITSFNTIEGYISMEFLAFFFIFIIAFYVGSSAGATIAGQIENKTIDFNLSQPISRTIMVLAEAIVTIKFSALIVISTAFSMFIFGKIFNSNIALWGLLAFTITAIALVWAIYGIGIFLSSLLRSRSSVMLLTFGLTLTYYIVSSLARIVEKLKDFNKISLSHFYDPETLLKTGNINWENIIILLAVFLIGLIGSIIIFNKKDL